MNTTLQTVFVGIPPADMPFFTKVAAEKGWQTTDVKKMLWDRYIKLRPKNVDITDEEIMAEVRSVRYGEV